MDSLKKAVTKFLKLATIVQKQLEKAETAYKLARDELIQSKQDMEAYDYKLEMKEITHTEDHNNVINNKWKMCHWVTGFTLGLAAPICYPIIASQTATLKDTINKVKKAIDNIQGKLDEMTIENNDLIDFINMELDLIRKWDNHLKQAVDNHEDLTDETIKDDMKILKDSITVLRNTCIEYIKHNFPSVLW